MAKQEPQAIRGDEPAFPCDEIHGDGTSVVRHHLGLSRRMWFAGRALTGLLASQSSTDWTYAELRERSYAMADEMLNGEQS
jgi:hypothetical protein